MVSVSPHSTSAPGGSLLHKLNTIWHERALQVFMVIVLLHWAEHLTQAFQIWGLGMARPDSRGMLGQFFPWLATSEVLHYGYALVMLAGLIVLLPGFQGRSRHWWILALVVQVWHHFEHLLLQGQVIVGKNLLDAPFPLSIVQIMMPTMRAELHLFYNAIVFIPMIVAMYYHMYPPKSERETVAACSCRRVGRTTGA